MWDCEVQSASGLYDLAAFLFANAAVFEPKRMDFRDETI